MLDCQTTLRAVDEFEMSFKTANLEENKFAGTKKEHL